ncbi:hypothetical protein HNQ03_000509 [Chryseobacterium sp. 16F]|uniref:DUF4956 domain-containing protein n=2 Tax=Frigoriflavimonas asaccharolytica TaxID=2735899 RepID=A0A8J8K7Y9_9FLAO|nr:hypothetical protein [Frigoriflavimonas asaccharolytica]
MKVEVSIGIGFGLFAIFSILRFRTESFSIQTITFLFVSITLSMLDVLLPISNLAFLLGINLVIVSAYILLIYLEKKSPAISEKNTMEIIATLDFLKLNDGEKKEFLKENTNFEKFSFQVKSINLIENSLVIKMTF